MFELSKTFAFLKTWKSHFSSLKHSKCLSLSALYVVLMLWKMLLYAFVKINKCFCLRKYYV